MKNLRTIGFLLLTFCLITNTYSQGTVSIHFGPSLPVSDFAGDDIMDEKEGGAAVGLNVGLQYIYLLSTKGIGVFGGIDLNYNGLKKEYKEDVEDLYESMGIPNADFIFFKYINIPLTAGLNYSYQADEKIGVFANAGLSLNFLRVTDMEIEVNGETVTQEMNLSTSIGYKIGGGVLINERTSVSLDYFALGVHDLDGEIRTTGFSEDIDGEQKVDIVTLTLGVRF